MCCLCQTWWLTGENYRWPWSLGRRLLNARLRLGRPGAHSFLHYVVMLQFHVDKEYIFTYIWLLWDEIYTKGSSRVQCVICFDKVAFSEILPYPEVASSNAVHQYFRTLFASRNLSLSGRKCSFRWSYVQTRGDPWIQYIKMGMILNLSLVYTLQYDNTS